MRRSGRSLDAAVKIARASAMPEARPSTCSTLARSAACHSSTWYGRASPGCGRSLIRKIFRD
jgi:hypothetical protein